MTPGGAGRPADLAAREEALRAALRQSRLSLALAALLLLGFLGGLGYLWYVAQKGLPLEEDQILAEARKQLAAHRDEIVAEAADLAAEVVPPAADALAAQAESAVPAYVQAVDRQGDKLIDDLEGVLRKKARARVHKLLQEQRRVLEEEFPEVKDPQLISRMLDEFERAFDDLLKRYYVDDFRAASRDILQTWRAIPPAPAPKPGEPPLARQLVLKLQEWTERALLGAPPQPEEGGK